MFDPREQLEKIQEGLLPEETVYAVFDMKGGGTGCDIAAERSLTDNRSAAKRVGLTTEAAYAETMG
jgi:hypothetical protein